MYKLGRFLPWPNSLSTKPSLAFIAILVESVGLGDLCLGQTHEFKSVQNPPHFVLQYLRGRN